MRPTIIDSIAAVRSNQHKRTWLVSLNRTNLPSAIILAGIAIAVTTGVIIVAQTRFGATIPAVVDHRNTRVTSNEVFTSKLHQLKAASETLEVSNLRDTDVGSNTQIRIWTGFGLSYPHCMIIEPYQKAMFVGPMIVDDRGVDKRDGSPAIEKTVFGAPRSGWEKFLDYLRQQGIDLPSPLKIDDPPIIVPDGHSIAIEIKRDQQYGMVHYSVFSKSKDGQKAFAVCHTIEKEFGVRLVCDQ